MWWKPFRQLEGFQLIWVDLAADGRSELEAASWLNEAELLRSKLFREKHSRRRFVLCRAALRILLCDRLKCDNRKLAFGYGNHGKPFALIVGHEVAVRFNVSHSGEHGLIVIGEGNQLGVDIEMRCLRRPLTAIGDRVFGVRERRALASVPAARKADCFYRFWTFKEALLKGRGTGFSLSPAEFEIPAAMIDGAGRGYFNFPDRPEERWSLADLGRADFAAALAWRNE